MQIEEGKYYRTRDGQKEGPMKAFNFPGNPNEFIVRSGDGRVWSATGVGRSEATGNDLIAEWTDPAPEPAKVGLTRWPAGVTETRGDGWSVEVTERWVHLNGYTLSFSPSDARDVARLMLLAADQAEAAK